VKPLAVVERQPVQNLVFRPQPRGRAHVVEPLDLQLADQRFGDSIVPAIALAAHRALLGEGRQLTLEALARIFAASIRMEDQPRRRLSFISKN